MTTVARRILAGAALPLSGLAWALHRRMVGRRAVVHVEIEEWATAQVGAATLSGLARLAEDPCVCTVLVELRSAPAGWAVTADLRRVLGRLRAAGKRVVVWVESPGNATMWVGSAADEVYIPPLAELEITGLGSEASYFRSLLDQVGVTADVEAAGAYKSFGEPFRRTHASPEALDALESLLDDLQGRMVRDIAGGRGTTDETVRGWMEAAPLRADDALRCGAIDGVAYLDFLVDAEVERAGDEARQISFASWWRSDRVQVLLGRVGCSGAIAVVHLEGSIVVDDDASSVRIRSRAVAPVLRALGEDVGVHAVVLHIDSPGGSAYASDVLWREVGKLAATKPVVACFADVAASGGYYLASAAHEIVARDTTLTGSIGVFGGKLVTGGLFRKLGVRVQPVARASQALRLSSARPFDDTQRARLVASLQDTYDGFVERTAAGRGVAVEVIEPHCRGRVWTGEAARVRGLVDLEGDLVGGIRRPAALAELPDGSWGRRDLSPCVPSGLASVLRDAIRRRVPGAQLLQRVLPDGVAGWLHTFAQAEGQPLAMLAFPELLHGKRR